MTVLNSESEFSWSGYGPLQTKIFVIDRLKHCLTLLNNAVACSSNKTHTQKKRTLFKRFAEIDWSSWDPVEKVISKLKVSFGFSFLRVPNVCFHSSFEPKFRLFPDYFQSLFRQRLNKRLIPSWGSGAQKLAPLNQITDSIIQKGGTSKIMNIRWSSLWVAEGSWRRGFLNQKIEIFRFISFLNISRNKSLFE